MDYYGAKLSGRNAHIFMEFMAGTTASLLLYAERYILITVIEIGNKFCG